MNSFRAGPWQGLSQHWVAVCLAMIVATSMGLATYWVFLVPIYQSPDENAHWDYALCIYQRGGLFSARSMQFAEANFYNQHPYTHYLQEKVDFHAVAFKPHSKLPSEYGTPEYFAEIDRNAPRISDFEVTKLPALMRIYPFGYYALAAAWMAFIRLFTDSLTALFFATRFLSVLMLGANLLFSYGILRELRFPPLHRLAIVACLGCFPLVSFIGSYIQPDNLGFLLATACWYFSLVVKRRPDSLSSISLLGLALGGLFVAKLHFFLCVAVPVLAMLLTEFSTRPQHGRRLLIQLVLLAAPTLALGGVHFYTVHGVTNYFGPPTEQVDSFDYIVGGLRKALLDYYAGLTHASFYGIFGWLDTPLVFGGDRLNRIVWLVIQIFGLLVIGLTVMRMEQVVSRLIVLAGQGRRRLALRMAFSNPLVNSYFMFTALMILLYVWLDNRFGAQGRNWIPFVLPFLLTAVAFAPRAFTLRRMQRGCSSLMLACLVIYVSVAGYWALRTVSQRYYGPLHGRTLAATALDGAPVESHEVVWQERVCQLQGGNPFLVYEIPRQFVDAVRIRFTLDEPSRTYDLFQAYWKADRHEFTEMERTWRLPVLRMTGPQTVEFQVGETIDHLRIDPATLPGRFRIDEVSLLRLQDERMARR